MIGGSVDGGVGTVVARGIPTESLRRDRITFRLTFFPTGCQVGVGPRIRASAAKRLAVGANVVVAKNKVNVVPNFPNMGLQMVFILCVVFLGILIPLIVYFVTVHGKQKAAAAEVGAAVEQIVAGNPMGMQQGYAPQAYQQPQQAFGQPPAAY